MHDVTQSGAPPPQDAALPRGDGRRVVMLAESASKLEHSVLEEWLRAGSDPPPGGDRVELVRIPSPRLSDARRRSARSLEAAISTDDDPLLAPVRVAWLPREGPQHASRLRSFVASMLFGDPYDPGRLRQWWIRRLRPERCKVICGDPAPLSDLRQRWRSIGGIDRTETTGLAEFVARQATITLERAERRMRGMRYKVPRFVDESILERPGFRGGVARLARELSRDPAQVESEARECLREIAATHSPYVIDLTAQLCRLMYRRGYGDKLHYDRDELERVYALAQRHPVVFLPSHKSNLDHLVLMHVLHENGHPPNHTAGGINMNFFPIGPLMRRSGVFFIRRTFKGEDVYRFVLGLYIDYLIEKRFPLEWYVEGGRSRSGKLLPPRFGLLAYVVDAYRRAKAEDVCLIPVSIAYDQIQDVGSYVSEQQGGEKERESFGWFVKVFRSLHRRYGGIHLRFGEPLSLREAFGENDPAAQPNADDRSIAIQKLAFEVAVRINRVTPITPTSMVTLALLGAADRAMTLAETVEAVDEFVDYARRARLPSTSPLVLGAEDAVRATLEGLMENGVVSSFDEGPQTVYAIRPQQHLTAAYYRNTIIHFFVNGAIAEVALVRAAEPDAEMAVDTFWRETLQLRDLLKFEFFFSEKEAFQEELRREIATHDENWETTLAGGREQARQIVARFKPYTAHLVLRPFLEAYRVVGDALEACRPDVAIDDADFVKQCLGLGKQYVLQKRIRNAESVSKVLLQTALKLARNRGLLEPNMPEAARLRHEFASEIRKTIRRVDAIDALAAARRAGLLP